MSGAAIHDVGQPGVNNVFYVKTRHPVAIRYNDKSVLENMHLAITYECIRTEVHLVDEILFIWAFVFWWGSVFFKGVVPNGCTQSFSLA